MTRSTRIGWIASAVLGVIGLGVLASAPAAGAPPKPSPGTPGTYTVSFDDDKAKYHYKICMKSTTTTTKYGAGGGDRVCSSKNDAITSHHKFDLTVEYAEGDDLWIDFEMFTGIGDTSKTKDDIVITGVHKCDIGGLLHSGTFDCDWSAAAVKTVAPPTIAAYEVDVHNPNAPVMALLNLMAWLVSAAAVIGLILTGTIIALQVRRGVTGEMGEYWTKIVIIGAACLMASAAGPAVEFFGFTQ